MTMAFENFRFVKLAPKIARVFFEFGVLHDRR